MKKLLLVLVLFASAAFAEPSFNEMQNLIDQKQFAAAEQGLELIIKNHPTSAKAFYSMAQAQAGLGHQDKAQFALNKAKGLDPSLKFASESNVAALETAITPQVAKIEKVESSMSWFTIFLIAVVALGLGILARIIYLSKRDDEDTPDNASSENKPILGSPSPASDAVTKNYVDTTYANTVHDVKPLRHSYPRTSTTVATAQPQVVNHYYPSNGGSHVDSNNGLLTGVLLGSMMSGHGGSSSNNTTIIEREVIVERPVQSHVDTTSSSWDDTPSTPTKSSWDDTDRSSSSSSSWDSSSSDSSSSSSWDSSSSSSSDSSW